MEQPSLFGDDAPGAHQTAVIFTPDFEGWQRAARAQLIAHRDPAMLWWQACADGPKEPPRRPAASASGGPRVPKAFVAMARAASCHRRSDRWALLYRVLWRLTHGERHLMQLGGDPDIARLTRYAKAVRRDVHKMKAFVRFRAVPDPDASDGEPRYVAWFEPEHFIVEYASGFFRRRFANMRWSILTPYACAHYEGGDSNAGAVWFSPGADKSAAPEGDVLEDAWRIYYRSIFNPARVKVRAMQSEMPQKYWKNMLEAHLIPSLLREADRRVDNMQATRKDADTLNCGPVPASPDQAALDAVARSPADSLYRLALQATTCRACPLWGPATQTVFGEGPANARLMIVGEQPGDAEDLAGRPFVGPAGQLLDRALIDAGLERRAVYLTNAVKHFKYTPRGKTRLHARPEDPEVLACRPWLTREIERVEPRVILAMGATAGRSLLGRSVQVLRERGRALEAGERRIWLTTHPSYLLRLNDARAKTRAYAQFVDDIARAGELAVADRVDRAD